MPIEFACHACGKRLRAKSVDQAGNVIKCPACGEPVVIPQPDAAEPDAAPRVFPTKVIALAGGGVVLLAVVSYFVLGGKSQPEKTGKAVVEKTTGKFKVAAKRQLKKQPTKKQPKTAASDKKPVKSKSIPTPAKTSVKSAPRQVSVDREVPPPKTTKLPAQETSLPVGIAEIPDYFPPLVFGDNERTHRIYARGPSRLLAAMTEPKLCSGERKDDALPGAKQWQGHTIHRVLVMGERPYKRLCVRVQKTLAGDYTATLVELGGRVGSHKTGFKPGPIKRQETIKLSQQQWSNLETTLRETKLTGLPTLDGIQGRDGTTCIIETVSGNRYHVVRRWGGRVENRAFNRVARDILKLANVDEKHLGVPNYMEVKDNTVVMVRRGDDWAMFRLYDQSGTGAKIDYKLHGMGAFAAASGVKVKDIIDIYKGTFRLKWSAGGAGRGYIYYAGNNRGTTPGLGICVTDLEPDVLKRANSSEIQAADLVLDYWLSPFDQLKRSEEDIDRRATIETLGPIGPDAVSALIKMLGHKDYPLRKYAEFALTRLGPAVVPALIQALTDKSYRVRRNAAEALGKIVPVAKEAVHALSLALQDKNYTVRRKAAQALGEIGPEAREAVRALGLALQDKKVRVVWGAAEALGKIGPAAKAALPALVNALKADDSLTRYRVAKTLGEIGAEAKSVVPALSKALSDEDATVRNYAAKALGKIGPEAKAAVPALVRMFKAASAGASVGPVVRGVGTRQPQAWSRSSVAEALGKIGPDARSAVPFLVRALKDKNISVRINVAEALGRFGPVTDEVVPALLQALKDPDDGSIRSMSAKALGKIGAKAAKLSVSALIQALKDRDSYVRWKVIEALGKIGPVAKKAVPALQALLASPNERVQKAAKEAISKIDPDAKLEPPPPTPPAPEEEEVF